MSQNPNNLTAAQRAARARALAASRANGRQEAPRTGRSATQQNGQAASRDSSTSSSSSEERQPTEQEFLTGLGARDKMNRVPRRTCTRRPGESDASLAQRQGWYNQGYNSQR
jgi:hypothetical protein